MPRSLRVVRIVVFLALLVGGFLLLPLGQAETPKGKKYALLVGVRAYNHRQLLDLEHTENDVEELGKLLKTSRFTEIVLLTSTRGEKNNKATPTAANIRLALKRLLNKVTKHDTILVALSGHGLKFDLLIDGKKKDEGFFCPADARPRDAKSLPELSKTMLGFTELFKELDESGVGVKLLLVDACRNEPEGFKSSDVDTLPRPTKGTAALFSCKSGEKSYEKAELKHGIFFHFVLEGLGGKAMNDGEITWDDLSRYVRRQVSRESPKLIAGGGRQTPHEIRNLEGDSPVLMTAATAGARPEVRPKRAGVIKGEGKEITNSIDMKLVRIPAGKYMMGAAKEDRDAQSQEKPQHEVEITRDFYLGVYEVTQREWMSLMKINPSKFQMQAGGSDDFPVETVSHEEAQDFIDKLNKKEAKTSGGWKYSLPTEAQWEYACRGGDKNYKKFHFGNNVANLANCSVTGPKRTSKVGSYKPNGFGLYDMHGNVWEWCADWYDQNYYAKSPKIDPVGPFNGSAKVNRGGGWDYYEHGCRSAYRGRRKPSERHHSSGFRVAMIRVDK